jgi:hypothetical protein
MYNIGPLDSIRRLIQRLQRESSYWISRVTRVVPTQRGRGMQMPDADSFKGSPVVLIVAGGCILACLCLTVIAGITALLLVMGQVGM